MGINFHTSEVQVGSLNRPFKMISVGLVPKTERWVLRNEKNELRHHWLYVFKYLDNGSLFAVEVDHFENPIKLEKHYEFPELKLEKFEQRRDY